MDDTLPLPPPSLLIQDAEVCGICLNAFSRPLLLPCLHSFCEPCLKANVSPKLPQLVHCPTCDKSFIVENGLESLPLNLILLRTSGENEVVCQVHPKVESSEAMYCKTCIKKVCPMFACLNKPHGTHDVMPLAELINGADGERQRILTAAGQVDSTFTATVRQATDNVGEKRAQLLARADEVRDSLRAVARQRAADLEAALQNELRRVDEYQAVCAGLCDKRLAELEDEKSAVERAAAFARDLAGTGSGEEVITMGRTVVRAMETLRDRPMVCRSPAMGRISHEETDDEDSAAMDQTIRNLLGDLSIVHISGRFSTSNVPKEKDGTVTAYSGQSATMTVTSKSSDGKKSAAGGDCVTAQWETIPEEGAERPDVKIDDNMDGTYKLTYTLPKDGTYKLRVALNGDEIGDSPFQFVASKDGGWALDPEHCSKGIVLQDSRRTVLKSALGHSSVLGLPGWSEGSRTWRLKVSQKQNCYAGVALQVPDAMTWKGSRSEACVWCFSTNGYKYSDVGVESTALGENGSLVDITLDCDKHTLTMKNVDSGKEEVITGLPADTKFYPWFHLYYLRTCFNILSPEAAAEAK